MNSSTSNNKMLPEKELIKIGKRLRALRKLKGYSNPDTFAYDHNLNRSQYGKYEAGRTNLSISTLITILNCFDLNLQDFFGKDYGKDNEVEAK